MASIIVHDCDGANARATKFNIMDIESVSVDSNAKHNVYYTGIIHFTKKSGIYKDFYTHESHDELCALILEAL